MTTATANLTGADYYASQFERLETQLHAGAWEWMAPIRRAAMARFRELGFPGPRDEYWRNTSVKPLKEAAFVLAEDQPDVDPAELEPHFTPRQTGPRAVIVNGRFSPALSSLAGLPDGVAVLSLAQAAGTHRDLVEQHLTQYAAYGEHPFVALNTAFVQDGIFIHVPRGVVVEEPIQVLVYSAVGDQPTVSHPRILVVAEENSQLKLVETVAGRDGSAYFCNAVVELALRERAVVHHYRLQNESRSAFHFATVQSDLGRGSVYENFNIVLGGRLSRADTNLTLSDEAIEAHLIGLYLGGDSQHMDNHTSIDHARPNCHTHELYKGILRDRASAVFNGKILVRQDAQKTDAIQSNHCLLLSGETVINTRPQLEIYADDVKCTHGATVGQINEDGIFYLRSRGIDEQTARALLIASFATEVADRVRLESFRDWVRLLVEERFSLGRILEEQQ